LDLAVALVDPAIARQVVNAEAARFQAVFDSSYVRNRIDSPPGFAAGGSPDTTFDRISASATQPLTGGGSISLRHSIDKTAPHFVPLPDFVNTSAGLEFQQPLLRGAGYQVNTASIQIASTQAGIADAQAKLTAIQVLSEVERAYWNAYAAQQFLAIAQQQYELADKQVAATRILAAKAIITIVDQQQSETGLLFRRSAVVAAETNLRLAQRALKRIMQRSDLAISSSERLDTITPPNPLGLTFNRQSLAERAIGNRMELLQNRLQLIANGLDIAVQQNSRLPRLDLIADLDALGLGGAYNDSFESLESGKFGNRLGGVSFQMPMGRNYAALARLEQANLRRRQLSIDQRRVSVAITQQVYDAIDRVELSWERYLIARESVTTAQKTFEGETKIFMSGKSTSINVLITISNLGDAQSQEVQAATDYQIAKVDLALAVGAMLGYGQVDWDPCRGATSALPE
jgi:outer membrane protein TolC